MEIIVQIVKQVPPFWPRVLVLVGIGLLFFLPEARTKLAQLGPRAKRNASLKELMELRKLELEIAELETRHPQAAETEIAKQLDELLHQRDKTDAEPKNIAWRPRLSLTLAGALSVVAVGTLVLWRVDRLEDHQLIRLALADAGLAVACSFVMSAFPCHSRWECVFRGFVIPVFVGTLIVTARGIS